MADLRRDKRMLTEPVEKRRRERLAELRIVFEGEEPRPGCERLVAEHDGEPDGVFAITDVTPVDPAMPDATVALKTATCAPRGRRAGGSGPEARTPASDILP